MKTKSMQSQTAMSTRDHPATSLRPKLHPGVFVFATVDTLSEASQLAAVAVFRESEGITVVMPEAEALRAGLTIGFRSAWITLEVHSDLHAVGLTAAFSRALAGAGIACNVMAAVHHDHLFVPADRGEDALACLRQLDLDATTAVGDRAGQDPG